MTGYAEQSDDTFRAWLRGYQHRAAAEFGSTVVGADHWGWRLRSLSAEVSGPGGPRWLRVGTERESDLPHPCWDGMPTSTAVAGVPKPTVLSSVDWVAEGTRQPRRVRADIMTLMPGRPCADREPLHAELDVPDTWWAELRGAVDVLRATPSDREVSRWSISPLIREAYGDEVAQRMAATEWETVHGDLHWNNLLRPQLGIIDWEMWGRGPVGTDPACLYCTSLLAPETARRVWRLFEDVLDTPAGRTALFRAAARLLHRAPREFPELTVPLEQLVDRYL